MRENSPCKGCTDRHTACHGGCGKYQAWLDRYHAQQKYLNDNRYRFSIPRSASRDELDKNRSKFGAHTRKQGGEQ